MSFFGSIKNKQRKQHGRHKYATTLTRSLSICARLYKCLQGRVNSLPSTNARHERIVIGDLLFNFTLGLMSEGPKSKGKRLVVVSVVYLLNSNESISSELVLRLCCAVCVNRKAAENESVRQKQLFGDLSDIAVLESLDGYVRLNADKKFTIMSFSMPLRERTDKTVQCSLTLSEIVQDNAYVIIYRTS